MSTATLHIIPVEIGRWAVRNEESSTTYPTQVLAIANAVGMLQNLEEAEVIVHDSDGRVVTCLSIRHFPADVDRVDDADDAALRAEALRITPSNDRLRAMIGKFSLPPGDYDSEEIPC
jgi:hypothetical protein